MSVDGEAESQTSEVFRIIHVRNKELQLRGEEPPIPEPILDYVKLAIEHGHTPGQIADQLTKERTWREMYIIWAQKPFKYQHA